MATAIRFRTTFPMSPAAAPAARATQPANPPRPTPRRRHRRAQRRLRGKHAVKARQMRPWRRHQRREPGHEIHRLEHDVRGAVAVRGLQAIAHLPLRGQREALDRHRRPAHVAGEALELRALIRLHPDARVQRKPRTLRHAWPRLCRPCRHALQGKHLLPRTRADRHPVGDRVADQVIHGAARLSGICR